MWYEPLRLLSFEFFKTNFAVMNTELQAHYIAFKTLRQRCLHLQKRLDSVEEENCQLKLEKLQAKDQSIKKPVDTNYLEGKIILLSKQISKMSHQLQIIGSENQTLWSDLSKLLPGSDNLGKSFFAFGVPECLENKLFENQPTNTNTEISKLTNNNTQQSLEEISLKLMNSVFGKSELENKYSENFEEISSLSNLPVHFDSSASINSMKTYMQKLQDFREALLNQQRNLKDTIKTLKKIPKFVPEHMNETVSSSDINLKESKSSCNVLNDNAPAENSDKKVKDMNSTSYMICPICAENFTGKFNNFFKHVNSHFDDEEDDVCSGNFEVIS